MKVLHVSHGGLGKGGVSSVILSIVSKLHSSFKFGCVVYSRQLAREKEFQEYGELHRIKAYSKGNILSDCMEKLLRPCRLTIGIYRICRNGEYDIIHCHNGFDAAFCLLGAKLAGVKKRIVHTHNPIRNNCSFARRILLFVTGQMIDKYATARIGCSEHVCNSAYKKDSIVIYNSIDVSSFVWHVNHNKNIIKFIHVGRFCKQKNQLFIIEIFKEIHERIENVQLYLIGFGEEQSSIEQAVRKYNLADKVSIIDGKSVDISSYFTQSDYMIFPSIYEGFGIVLLEAQASGVHCFVSNVVPEVTNVGLWETIDLSEGCQIWADKIISRINSGLLSTKEQVYNNLNRFRMDNIALQYYNIYNEN